MKIIHIASLIIVSTIITIGLYNANSGGHKTQGKATIANPTERPRNINSQTDQTNSVNSNISHEEAIRRPMQEKARLDIPNTQHSEKELVALYNTDESIRAFALRDLEDTPAARQILAAAITDPSPKIRNSSLERIIEIEDRENIAFQANVDLLIENEQDSEVIETALSYYSLLEDGMTYTIIENVIKRANLSVGVLAYAGEILYKHYKMNKEDIDQLFVTSPSYAALDQAQIISLEESLGEVFHADN